MPTVEKAGYFEPTNANRFFEVERETADNGDTVERQRVSDPAVQAVLADLTSANHTDLVAIVAKLAATLSVRNSSVSKGYQQLTSDGTARSVASLCAGAALPAGATKVLIVPTSAIRYRDDGTDPTAAVGMPAAQGQPFTYDGDLLSSLKVVGVATLDCWFYA